MEKFFSSQGLPDEFRRSYQKMGVDSLYQWQSDCIQQSGVLTGRNLVYCAPTGGGKTLVAELAMLKVLTSQKKKVIFVLPYVSLVQEKEKYFRRLVHIYNLSKEKRFRLRIKGFHGDTGARACYKYDILICTIEKSNMVVNALVQQGFTHRIGCVVVDEMHVLGEKDRGYHLEILISKLKMLMVRYEMHQAQSNALESMDRVHIQLIALSATVGNIAALSSWFAASLYQTTYRPVVLTEHIAAGVQVLDLNGCLERTINSSRIKSASEPIDQLTILVEEGLRNGQQVIVFCSSRNACQIVCKKLCAELPSFFEEVSGSPIVTHAGNKLQGESLSITRDMVVESAMTATSNIFFQPAATASGGVVEETLSPLYVGISTGVAYHHAGLLESDRELVESCYKSGYISVLVCTSTLAAGVNLPAGRVIINGMKIGFQDTLSVIQYRQMVGRAGRAGLTFSAADSFLLVKASERPAALRLTNSPYPNVCSQMNPEQAEGNRGFLRAILELCSLGLCDSRATFILYVQQTLFYLECTSDLDTTPSVIEETALQSLQFLLNSKIIDPVSDMRIRDDLIMSEEGANNLMFKLSRLGRAIIGCNMNPDEAIVYYGDLLRARDYLNLETELHVAYLCAPLSHALMPDFNKIFTALTASTNEKNAPLQRVIRAIGLEEGVLMRLSQCPPSSAVVNSAGDALRRRKSSTKTSSTKMRSSLPNTSEAELLVLCRCKRLWAAQILVDLLDCQDHHLVSRAYGAPVTDIDNLINSAVLLSSKMIEFASEIGWTSLAQIVRNFNPRLKDTGGTAMEPALVELMSIKGMSVKTAKILLSNNSLDSCEKIASASAIEIAQCLRLSFSFDFVPSIAHYNSTVTNRKPDRGVVREETVVVPTDISTVAANETPPRPSNSDVSDVIVSPILTRSLSKRRREGGSADRVHDKESILVSGGSSRKRRRKSGSLRLAFDDSKTKSTDRTETRSTDITTSKSVLLEQETNAKQTSMNEMLINYSIHIINAARDRLMNKEVIDSTSAPPKPNLFERNEEDDEDIEKSSIGSSSGDLDWSSSGSSDSLVDLSEELRSHANSKIDDHAAFIEDLWGDNAAPWLRKATDKSDTKAQKISSPTRIDPPIPVLGQTGAEPFQSPQSTTDHIHELHAVHDFVLPGENHVEIVKSPLKDSTFPSGQDPWLDIPDEILCNMMNAAERRYSLQKRQERELEIRQSATRKDATLNAGDKSESGFIDIIFVVGDGENMTTRSPTRGAPVSEPSGAVEAPSANTSEDLDELICLELEVPDDFFEINLDSDIESNTVFNGKLSEDAAMDQLQTGHAPLALVQEPFLSQYTPSKIKSANKYMCQSYTGLLIDDDGVVTKSNNIRDDVYLACDAVRSLGTEQISSVADLVDLSCASEDYCVSFLELVRTCRCVCVELVYRSIPAPQSVPAISFGRKPIGKLGADLQQMWIPLSCRRPTGEFAKGGKSSISSEMFVISGVALCFGNSVSYYLPLPCPPPVYNSQSKNAKRSDLTTTSSISSELLPINIKILIARFVGTGALFSKCPELKQQYEMSELFGHRKKAPQLNAYQNAETPLYLVSKSWCEAYRRAIQEEWRRGKCIEWRIINYLMSSERITKVGMYLKDQLVALRERDVITNGCLEDPVIAAELLQIDEATLSLKSIRPSDNPALPLCCKMFCPSKYFHAKVNATLKVISVLRKMADLEVLIQNKNMMNLFMFVEMPVCKCVVDMECTGMPISTSVFTQLRQDLSDRCKIICHYFQLVQGDDFKLSSEKHIAMFKKRLGREILNDVLLSKNRGISSTNEYLSVAECEYHPDVKAEVSLRMMEHPLVKLLAEWRSHSSALVSCSSVLSCITSRHLVLEQDSNRRFNIDRIHGSVRVIGSATGRMTVVSPPLQQMAHECIYRLCKRPSIQDELVHMSFGTSLEAAVHVLNYTWDDANNSQRCHWVRITQGRSNYNNLVVSPGISARFVEICYSTIGSHICHGCDSDGATRAPRSLADVWRSLGCQYAKEEESCIRVVKIRPPSKADHERLSAFCCCDPDRSEDLSSASVSPKKHYCYFVPADKVCRLDAPIQPHEDEWAEIKCGISSSSDAMRAHQWTTVSPRSGFIASKNMVLMSVDYSQIELRILTHFCKDKTLLQAFRQETVDVFKGICSRWKRKPVADVSESERDAVKQLCYAIIYGAGSTRIAAVAACSEEEAKFMYQDFLKCHPGITKFISHVKKGCLKSGFVSTILGRRRYLKDISSENKASRARAERQAVNTVCQGSAADLIKLAMGNITCRFQSEFKSDSVAFRRRRSCPGGLLYEKLDDIRMILQIHDELLFEVPEWCLDKVASIVVHCMEHALDLEVPLKVKVSIGRDWSNLQPYSGRSVSTEQGNDKHSLICAESPPNSCDQNAPINLDEVTRVIFR